MLGIVQFVRVFKIYIVLMRHTFTPIVIGERSSFLRFLSYFNFLSYGSGKKSRGESILLAIQSLGPIFVKFGQLLSTRSDLLPADIIIELEKLQDRVPPFSGKKAREIIEKELNQKIEILFSTFDEIPLASASIAQVHPATLTDGSNVIVKVTRPNIEKTIRHDIAILYTVAHFTERFWAEGKRLRPVELVAEFEQTILDELDMMREAANASQLRRNFLHSDIMYVPKIYWSHTGNNVLVMERIYGVQISDIETLHDYNTNMKRLAENGVTIFFTQVFKHSFFHADMHPGNLFVDVKDPENPKYIGVDFGIMGTLSPVDQRYLAENMLAFFNRDYRQIAILHVESGWVSADTRIDQFESAIRTVSEPIFERPLKDISFAQVLLRLFQTAKRFNMEVQPQLMLLQKTLFTIEALGRRLYPELNLWETAKPFLIDWIGEKHSLRTLSKIAGKNFQDTMEKVINSPALVFDILKEINTQQKIQRSASQLDRKKGTAKKLNRKSFLYGAGLALLIVVVVSIFKQTAPAHELVLWQWLTGGFGLLFLLIGWSVSK